MCVSTDDNITYKGICPSPTGEDRWGLMAISGVTCSFHWGRDGFGAEVEETVVDGMTRLGDIEAVDFVGKDEIYDCLDPEGTVFGGDVGESGSHGIHPHEASDAEGGREETRHSLPESRDVALRPRYTRHEKEHDGGEDHKEHHVLTIAHHCRERHAEEYAREQIWQGEESQLAHRDETDEIEEIRYGTQEVCRHHDVYHQVCHRLAPHDAHHATVAAVERHEESVVVLLARRSCRHSHTQEQRLLDDEHEHSGDDEIAISRRVVEYRHLLEVERPGGDLVLAVGVVARELHLNPGVQFALNSHASLENRLVGKHDAHVAVYPHVGLLHAVELGLEVLGKVYHSVGIATANALARLVETVAAQSHASVGRGVYHTGEFAAGVAMRKVNYRHGHLARHLVVVYPRIQERICQRHHDEEDEHALVAEHVLEFLQADIASVAQYVEKLVHCCHSFGVIGNHTSTESGTHYSIYLYSLIALRMLPATSIGSSEKAIIATRLTHA